MMYGLLQSHHRRRQPGGPRMTATDGQRIIGYKTDHPLIRFVSVAVFPGRRAAFANNHWQEQAVDTARQLKLLLGGKIQLS